MTTATAERPATQRRQPQPTSFRVLFEIGADRYAVYPLAADPSVAMRAFRFRKLTGDRSVHDVRYARDEERGTEFVSCDCKGFVRWSHCRHCRALAALELVPPALVKRPGQKKEAA